MDHELTISTITVERYLSSRSRWIRWREWANGRRYLVCLFGDRSSPLVVVAHSFRDSPKARQLARVLEQDWAQAPAHCRQAYNEILSLAPALVLVQLRKTNLCGCLGHRHMVVKEPPFAEPHEAMDWASVGEMDLAYERVESWQPLPLTDTALDTKFLHGSRLEEFHLKQFRLRMLSVLLHETHHLVSPHEPEISVRKRSLAFYQESLASYVENIIATLSLTIDRSFSRFG